MPHPAAERDQPEAIADVERAERLAQRRAGLLHLLAAHRAGDVHHQGQVARQLGSSLGGRRSQEQQRESIVAGLGVGEHGAAHQAAAEREHEIHVALHRRRDADPELAVAALVLNRVGGGVGSGEFIAPANLDGEGDRRVTPVSRRVAEPERVPIPSHQLGEPEDDGAGLPGLDRKNLGPDESVPHQRDERGILPLPDDRLVDGPRLLARHHLALELLLPLEEGEGAERGFAGQGIVIHALGHHAAVVAEALVDLEAGDPSFHPRAHRRADPHHRGRAPGGGWGARYRSSPGRRAVPGGRATEEPAEGGTWRISGLWVRPGDASSGNSYTAGRGYGVTTVPVAVKTTGEGEPMLARTRLIPGRVPSWRVVEARPWGSVGDSSSVTVPLPAVTSQLTTNPSTGKPF